VPKSAFSRRYATLREVLADQRRDQGITQTELARRLGKPQSFVSKVESGERRLDVIEFLELAKILDLDVCRVLNSLD
jgi:transcriptional regulator with XRE-family HTH domain